MADLNNYHPMCISVIPAAAKNFQTIIYDQLYSYLHVDMAFALYAVPSLPCWRQATIGVLVLTNVLSMVYYSFI